MSIEINYNEVLADLRLKQNAIEQAITGITALMSLGTVSGGNPSPGSQSGDGPTMEIPSDAFFNLSIVEATKKFLGMMKRPKTTQEIATALVEGGYNHTSKNFYSTIFSVLSRESAKAAPEIVKLKERWGLSEWYPNRRPTRTVRRGGAEPSVQEDSAQQSIDESAEPEDGTDELPVAAA